MRNLEEILRLMEIKRQLLRGIEDATQEMLACRREELPEQVKERQRFIDELERQDAALRELCAAEENGPAVWDAAMSRGDAGALEGELAEVYAAAQQQRAVMSRLRESEAQAMRRMKLEQDQLLEKIKSTNQGSAAKAARFYSAGAAGGGGSSRLGRA